MRWRGSRSSARFVRTVRPHGHPAVVNARELLDQLDLAELDSELMDAAAELEGSILPLDAIHVAAALELGDELEALVTYDHRIATAAGERGIPVIAPGR